MIYYKVRIKRFLRKDIVKTCETEKEVVEYLCGLHDSLLRLKFYKIAVQPILIYN